MGFTSICTAIYDYQPQSAGELDLKEGDILYILEKSGDDDWWRAKKRAVTEDEDEPEGLIPNNYVEPAQPVHTARALYDYTRQTEEEVSFTEDSVIHVYDVSDPDWTLVGVDDDYGFAPANYIEVTNHPSAKTIAPAQPLRGPPTPVRPVTIARPDPDYDYEPEQQPSPPASPIRDPNTPNARLAGIMGGIAPASPPATRNMVSPPLPKRQLTPEASDDEPPPPKPHRPLSAADSAPAPAPAAIRFAHQEEEDEDPAGVRSSGYSPAGGPRSPGGYHLYNISEMVSALGKRKKLPITLGLNIATGTIMLSPEKSRDGPTQEWSADRLDHYSIEGKHVFLELNRPSRSLDLHAGAKDTAKEIVAGLGEISGAHHAVGFKDVITASTGTGQKKGVVLYDFMAQGDDEVTVYEGDEVIVLDDTKSEEWWNVRKIKNGSEGVVPSSYVELTGVIPPESNSRSGANAGLTPVQQNRIEEERLAKEAAKADRARRAVEEARANKDSLLPERGSSLASEDRRSARKDKKSSKADGKPRSKPDLVKVRTWTDHSGSFKVDAQFLGIADGKIHLHKVNGVKIAVPVAKMSQTDVDYVEKVTNESIDENIPVADIIKMKRRNQESRSKSAGASVEVPSRSASTQQQAKTSDYDWFDFFLVAGVGPHLCERYAQAMIKDSMDETVLPDIRIETLRTLGLKEGDALKVMKHLDQRFGRNKVNGEPRFTGPGGVLKDNTRKRPDTNRTNNDTVDAQAFEDSSSPSDIKLAPTTNSPASQSKDAFDSDPWTIVPRAQAATPAPAPAPAPASVPLTQPLSQNFQALSLLQPLEPTPAPEPLRPASQPQVPQITQSPPPALSQQQTAQIGATPELFQQVGQTLQSPNTSQFNAPRQRPQPTQQGFLGSNLLPPPPRPMSAPQNAQLNMQPLQAQITGLPSNTHPAPAGQSLEELTALRMQQLLRPQPTGFVQSGMPMQNGFQPQPTGYPQQQFGSLQQPYLNGNASGSPFADSRAMMQPQQTNFGPFQQPGLAQGGINSILPPALAPQQTGFPNAQPQIQSNGFNQFQPQQVNFQQGGIQPQPTGYQQPFQPQPTGFGQTNGFGPNNFPPVPPIPQQPTAAPLMPQKTGPAPEIRFGLNPAASRLQAQPTGRRANLSQATPQNPFGF